MSGLVFTCPWCACDSSTSYAIIPPAVLTYRDADTNHTEEFDILRDCRCSNCGGEWLMVTGDEA